MRILKDLLQLLLEFFNGLCGLQLFVLVLSKTCSCEQTGDKEASKAYHELHSALGRSRAARRPILGQYNESYVTAAPSCLNEARPSELRRQRKIAHVNLSSGELRVMRAVRSPAG